MIATSPTRTPQRIAPRSWRFLASPGWIGAILGAVAFAVVCWTVLAPWQFSRNAERSQANAQVAAAATATPRPVEELLFTDRQPDVGSRWQPATATGTFEPEHQVYVRLRQDAGGAPASEIVVPLRLADGSAVLVDRGFVSLADTTNNTPLPALPTGTVTVTGRIQPDQPDPLHRPAQRNDGRTEVLAIDAGSFPDLTGPVRQGFLQLMAGSPAVLTPIGVPQLDEGPFLSYALQWCAFGGMALLAIGFFVVREYRDPRPVDGSPPETDQAGPIDQAGPVDPPATTEAVAPSADLTAAVGPTAVAAPPVRRSRRFDRSQLYDSGDPMDP